MINFMKNLLRHIRIKLSKSSKERSLKYFKEAEEMDSFFIGISTLLNVIGKESDIHRRKLVYNGFNIVYLPLRYVKLLRMFVYELYEKTEDPVVRGYMSKSNVIYPIEYVKNIHNEPDLNFKERLVRKAAFIFYNITLKHPFTDGNKRTAILTTNSFLEYNLYTIASLPFRESRDFIAEVAQGKKSEEDCRDFIRNHIKPLDVSEGFIKNVKEALKDIKR